MSNIVNYSPITKTIKMKTKQSRAMEIRFVPRSKPTLSEWIQRHIWHIGITAIATCTYALLKVTFTAIEEIFKY